MAPLWKRSGTRATGRGAGRLLGRVRGAGESSRGFFGRQKGRSAARDARRVPGKRGNQQPLLQEGEALPGPTVAFAKADEGDAGAPAEDWFRIVLAFLFPALGGLLFGYDIGATSGALVSLTSAATGGVPWFDLTPFQSGLVVSSSLFGALVSSVAAFFVGDNLGRRREILLAAVLYLAGTALEGLAQSYPLLLCGRLTYGLGIGFAMHGAPAYIAETAPQRVRGLLISLKEVLIVLGILLGYLASFLFVSKAGGWRAIYLVAAPAAMALFAGMSWLPASPRWLLLRGGGSGEVVASLRKLRGPAAKEEDLLAEAEAMEANFGGDGDKGAAASGGFAALLRRENLKPLLIGMSLMVFQQITGQPSVLYYATRIFQDAGFAAAESATAVSVVLGIFKLVMTGVAVFTVDVYGRRPLLLTGVAGMAAALFVLGSVKAPMLSVIALLLYVGCYQVSFGPVSWLIVGEVFPLAVRSSAIALASFANFGSNFLVSLALPTIQSALGAQATYAAFGVIALAALATIFAVVPETKGKSLEEIERMFK